MLNRVLIHRAIKEWCCLNFPPTIISGSISRVTLCGSRQHYHVSRRTSVLSAASSSKRRRGELTNKRQAKITDNKILSKKTDIPTLSKQTQQQYTPYTKPKQQTFQAPFSVFISCLPGLEQLLIKEVEYLRDRWLSDDRKKGKNSIRDDQPHVLPGGVKLTVPSLKHLYLLHLYVGTASHIYLRLNEDNFDGLPPLFRARGFPELQRKVKDMIISQRWDEWLTTNSSGNVLDGKENAVCNIQVHVTTSKSKLMHTKAIEERVKETIGQIITNATTDNINESDSASCIRLMVRIDRDVVQLSLDSSQTPLHRRGYRLRPHKAPLREDLAYALLMAGGLMPCWNLQPHFLTGDYSFGPEKQKQKMTLFDPFCGSGTIAIEGASLQMGLPPGRFRPPPLEGTGFCNPSLWEEMKSKALSVSRKHSLQVAAGDIDQKALDAAKSNARRAGVDGCIDFVKGSFVLHPLLKDPKGENASRSVLIVANPPYGKRLSLSSSHKTTQSNIYRKLAKAISSISTSSRKIDYAIIGKDMRTKKWYAS